MSVARGQHRSLGQISCTSKQRASRPSPESRCGIGLMIQSIHRALRFGRRTGAHKIALQDPRRGDERTNASLQCGGAQCWRCLPIRCGWSGARPPHLPRLACLLCSKSGRVGTGRTASFLTSILVPVRTLHSSSPSTPSIEPRSTFRDAPTTRMHHSASSCPFPSHAT